MLVLSRKESQTIKIGDDVTVVVYRVAGNRVSIGVQAPRAVNIRRGELEPPLHLDAEAAAGQDGEGA